jgi:hypothetical protein
VAATLAVNGSRRAGFTIAFAAAAAALAIGVVVALLVPRPVRESSSEVLAEAA